MDYNFVIFGSDGGFYKTAYSDIMELNSVIYRESLWGVNNKITALIYKLYHLPASQPSSSLQEFIIPRHQ